MSVSAPGYRLWLNHSKTLLVRIWDEGQVEVCSRSHPDDLWDPPIQMLSEEKS